MESVVDDIDGQVENQFQDVTYVYDKKDREYLKNINHSYNISQQQMSVYLSESGMYKLILRSKMPKTEKFSNWVTDEVLPSIRKFGVYELKKSSEKEKTKLLEQINYFEKQNKLMKNDLKKNKFPNGALVYVLDYSDEDENVDGIFRIGKSDNLKIRKTIYDTHMLHNKKVIDYELSDNPLQLENCLKSMLYEYRYKDRKDFFLAHIFKELKKNSHTLLTGHASSLNSQPTSAALSPPQSRLRISARPLPERGLFPPSPVPRPS